MNIQDLLNQLRTDCADLRAGVGRDRSTWANPSREAVQRLDAEATRWTASLAAHGHFDANESAFLARQLLFVKTREANILYPASQFRKFLPVSNEIPAGANEYTVKTWDIAGMAKIVANYAKDFPNVNTYVTETIAKIRSIADSYSYTIQDLRASAMVPNVSLDTRRAEAARMIHERTIEVLAAYGDSTANLYGFANHSAIPNVTGTTGGWATATGESILGDLHKIANWVPLQSKTVHRPDTMLLPQAEWNIIATKPYSTLNPTTVLEVFLESTPYIKNVDQWVLLDAANSNPDGRGARLSYSRILCYQRDPMVIQLEIPQEFEQLPPQLEGMQYTIPCHSRCGGVNLMYPLAACYAEHMIT